MSLQQLIDGVGARLTEADRQIVQTLKANPQEGAFLSVKDVAELASIHPTAVVRFAQKLGFPGYRKLRDRLRQDRASQSRVVDQLLKQLDSLKGEIFRKVVENEISTLQDLPDQILEEDLLTAARWLKEAGQIHLFGYGNSEALAMHMDMRLGRSGYRTHLMRLPERNLAIDLTRINEGDTVLAFTINTIDPSVPTIIEWASESESKTILIADSYGPLVHPAPDILLCAASGEPGDPLSLIIPNVICNSLVLMIAALDGGESLENVSKAGMLRKKLRAQARGQKRKS